MRSSQTLTPQTNETRDTSPLQQQLLADTLATANAMDYATAYLAGYFGSAIEDAARNYPDDLNIRRAAALYRAWQERAYDSVATVAGGAA